MISLSSTPELVVPLDNAFQRSLLKHRGTEEADPGISVSSVTLCFKSSPPPSGGCTRCRASAAAHCDAVRVDVTLFVIGGGTGLPWLSSDHPAIGKQAFSELNGMLHLPKMIQIEDVFAPEAPDDVRAILRNLPLVGGLLLLAGAGGGTWSVDGWLKRGNGAG